jgi:molybdopterin-binding protein
MAINLTSNSISSINTLINMCPNTFTFVPLKIYKDENGNSFASIETMDVDASVIFSGKVKLDSIEELDVNTGIVIRLPVSKAITSIMFNSAFNNLDVSKTRIIAKGENKKITVALYEIDETNLLEFPYTNIELFKMAMKQNKLELPVYEQFAISIKDIQEIRDCLEILTSPTDMYFISNGKNIQVSCSDNSGNNIEYKLDTESNSRFTAKFDISIKNIMTSLIKYKDFDIDLLLCESLAAITIKNDNVVATIGIPAAKD